MKAKINQEKQSLMEVTYMTESEAKKIFEIKPEIQTRGIILAKKGNKVLSVPANTHVAIIGSARSGKTFGYGHSYIKQCALRGESIVINDLRGDLYENFAKSLIDDGYDVKIFNVFNASNNTLKSDNWNCFSDLLSAPKNIGENTDLIADVIINNTCPLEREDNFYHMAKIQVLSALCSYIMLDANRTESQKNLYEVYKIIADTDNKVEHISKLYLNISINHPAYYAFYQFAQYNDEIQRTILADLLYCLSILSNSAINENISSKGFSLKDIFKRKTALFIVGGDITCNTHDFFRPLMITTLFSVAQSNKIPINFLFDEYQNIGYLPKDICLARLYARNINVLFMFQSIFQLKHMMPTEEAFEEFISNCDIKVFLEHHDATTSEYIKNNYNVAEETRCFSNKCLIGVNGQKIYIAEKYKHS